MLHEEDLTNSLLYPKQNQTIQPGVTYIQDVNATLSPLLYTAVLVLELHAQRYFAETLGNFEAGIVILAGKDTVTVGHQRFTGIGQRQSVLHKIPTDSVYVHSDLSFKLAAQTAALVHIHYSPTTTYFPVRYIKGDITQITTRGRYQLKRLVQKLLPEHLHFADKLLLVEVYTDSDYWSSYPPTHSHHDNLPTTSLYTTIYYHTMQPLQGFVFQRVYTEHLSLNETNTVQNQDVDIVPKGYTPVGVPDG